MEHHEPTEYWKAGPYLVNFMERYKLKEALDRAAADGLLPEGEHLGPGPGLLRWADVEAYEAVDPQNGRLRWLLEDLDRHRAFELLWLPPSLRYYDAGSVYESDEATSFTKRLIFSGWAVVPKVVSALVSFEAERRAYAGRSHSYTAEYRQRGGQRLTFRTSERTAAELRAGEADGRAPGGGDDGLPARLAQRHAGRAGRSATARRRGARPQRRSAGRASRRESLRPSGR